MKTGIKSLDKIIRQGINVNINFNEIYTSILRSNPKYLSPNLLNFADTKIKFLKVVTEAIKVQNNIIRDEYFRAIDTAQMKLIAEEKKDRDNEIIVIIEEDAKMFED